MNVICLLSGGLDSSVLAYSLVAEGHVVHGLSVNYGQRHARELEAAQAVAKSKGIRLTTSDLSCLSSLFAGSALTSSDVAVPHGHYADESMKATVVPNRNMVLLSLAGALAISEGADAVAYAAHSGDHAIYPDCRPEFATAMREALRLSDWEAVSLLTPFVDMTKAEIVAIGDKLCVPFDDTWSCYEGGSVHCGQCGTCIERKEAFSRAGVVDHTEYAT